ncbi:hypothetical protein CBD41_05465 [bacterium TMED181]|nr:alpha-ketoglutarate-dependent dioxygenase AlkB [Planctomycetota bacterium]OUW44561.1 MAG: hypothetical protein CBD41_05465 [bacterium TMED181]
MAETPDLFSYEKFPSGVLDFPDASLEYFSGLFDADDQQDLHSRLKSELHWNQGQIKLYGKEHQIPRLEAWHGDPGARYGYSGTELEPQPWTPVLEDIRRALSDFRSDLIFNSVLGNWYRDGEDAMGWHSDDEKELGPHPCIASLSFGHGRDIRFRHRFKKDIEAVKIHLEPGSLLLMEGATQENWQHEIPRRRGKNAPGERINLTFRTIRFPRS